MGNQPDNNERTERVISTNRRAGYDFFLDKSIEAGIMLLGTEVKALREGKCSLQEAYIGFPGGGDELYIMNMTIPEFSEANIQNHNPTRNRKLLLHHHQAKRFKEGVSEKGMTIVPLRIYFSGHLVKLEIALAKPKRKYDKRQSTKKKEIKRELNRKYKV